MRRALREYTVVGVRTTVPFFRWFLAQPAFVAGDVHAGQLDELLQQRNGEPFATHDSSFAEVGLVAAALGVAMRAHSAGAAAVGLGQPGTTRGPAGVRFRFEVDGRVHAVDVERTGGPWLVSLGGRRWRAQMHPSGQGWSLLLSSAGADDAGPAVARSFDVRLGWPESDRADVIVDGVPIAVTVAQVLAARRRRRGRTTGAPGTVRCGRRWPAGWCGCWWPRGSRGGAPGRGRRRGNEDGERVARAPCRCREGGARRRRRVGGRGPDVGGA